MPDSENNFTDKELGFGYWFVTHKLLLRRVVIVALIAISAPLYIFSMYHAIDYFFVRGVGERAALFELSRGIDYTKIHEAISPEPLKIGSPLVFGGARDRFDLIAEMENSNQFFWATFDYAFAGAGFTSPKEHGFILPNEQTYLMLLATPSASRPRALRVETHDLAWQRISRHDIPDPQSYIADRTNFTIRDVEYIPAVTRDNVVVSKARFTVTNNTAFSFWRVDFPVLLMRGRTPQAVNIVTAERFRSGETRTLEVSWFESLPPVDRVEVAARVNIFDPSAYMN